MCYCGSQPLVGYFFGAIANHWIDACYKLASSSVCYVQRLYKSLRSFKQSFAWYKLIAS